MAYPKCTPRACVLLGPATIKPLLHAGAHYLEIGTSFVRCVQEIAAAAALVCLMSVTIASCLSKSGYDTSIYACMASIPLCW